MGDLVRVAAMLVVLGVASSYAAAALGPRRPYRMGFMPTPPYMTTESVLATVANIAPRSDAMVWQEEPPWTELLAHNGSDVEALAVAYITNKRLSVVQLLRSLGVQQLVWVLDPQNGVERGKPNRALAAMNRTLNDTVVQAAFTSYLLVGVKLLQPTVVGVACEVNAIRRLAPAALYASVVNISNVAYDALRANGSSIDVSVTIQLEFTWSGFTANFGTYVGYAQERADFSFAATFGISSYPFFVVPNPTLLPADYWARAAADAGSRPLYHCEGGWATNGSMSNGSMSWELSEEGQMRYYERLTSMMWEVGATYLLDQAFADFAWDEEGLSAFKYMGLANSNLTAKPALTVWDRVFRGASPAPTSNATTSQPTPIRGGGLG